MEVYRKENGFQGIYNMRRIAVIDAETDPFRKGRIPQPFIWGFYDGTEYKTFDKGSDLALYLSRCNCVCYAHNGGKFDFHYLLEFLEPYDDIKIINGRIAQMYIGQCELRDSWLIINEPLAKYKKDDIDYSLMEVEQRDKPENRAKIEAYLKSDCVYLWEMVTEFCKRYGNVLTQAGAAMKQWQYLSGTVPEATDKEFYAELSSFYYGGRVQCFESGVIDCNFAVYDINSAYAYAMLQQHPYSAAYERIKGYAKGADFYVVECIAAGCFPFRNNGDNNGNYSGLSFPNDDTSRVYYVSKWEYAAGFSTNSVTHSKVVASIRFLKHTDFSVYVRKFWYEREIAKAKGDVLSALMAKLMMNSLYGKFAANPENYHNYMIVPPTQAAILGAGVKIKLSDAETMARWEFGGELGCWLLAQRKLDEFQQRYYNVATGASITGYVRAMLWRAIHSSKGVLYCDTDSIAVRSKGEKIALGTALGQWKHEGDFDRAGIAGKKLYIMRGCLDADGKRAFKVASKGARLTHSQLWQLAQGGVVEYEAEVPTYSIRKTPYFSNRVLVKTARGRCEKTS